MLEVEAKIRIDSVDQIRNRLKERGAVFIKKTRQADTYFNSPVRDFAVTDEALRVRNEGDYSEITYKGPKIKGTGAKAREEFNVRTDDPEIPGIILEKAGFIKSATVSKLREEYEYGGAKVALDIVYGLGEFIEIEIISDDRDSALETIGKVRMELGISGEHIADSYLEMLREETGN